MVARCIACVPVQYQRALETFKRYLFSVGSLIDPDYQVSAQLTSDRYINILHCVELLDFGRELTAACIVVKLYLLPTDTHPAGGEVRPARFSTGVDRPVPSSDRSTIETDHMVKFHPVKSGSQGANEKRTLRTNVRGHWVYNHYADNIQQ